jgi:hypothetical protein
MARVVTLRVERGSHTGGLRRWRAEWRQPTRLDANGDGEGGENIFFDAG